MANDIWSNGIGRVEPSGEKLYKQKWHYCLNDLDTMYRTHFHIELS